LNLRNWKHGNGNTRNNEWRGGAHPRRKDMGVPQQGQEWDRELQGGKEKTSNQHIREARDTVRIGGGEVFCSLYPSSESKVSGPSFFGGGFEVPLGRKECNHKSNNLGVTCLGDGVV